MITVQPFLQRDEWDCGIAACAMVAKRVVQPHATTGEIYAALRRLVGKIESTWTIDLYFMLREYGLCSEMSFYTAFRGVDPSYADMDFYQDSIQADEARVAGLFRKAEIENLPVYEKTLSFDDLAMEITTNQSLVIALVNKALLPTETRSCFGNGYFGHYIILCGYENERFAYMDPSRSHGPRWILPSQLDAARMSDGTDQDLIIVPVN